MRSGFLRYLPRYLPGLYKDTFGSCKEREANSFICVQKPPHIYMFASFLSVR